MFFLKRYTENKVYFSFFLWLMWHNLFFLSGINSHNFFTEIYWLSLSHERDIFLSFSLPLTIYCLSLSYDPNIFLSTAHNLPLCSKVVVHKIVALDILFYFMVVFFSGKILVPQPCAQLCAHGRVVVGRVEGWWWVASPPTTTRPKVVH